MEKREVAVVIFYDKEHRVLLQDRTGYKGQMEEHWGFFGGGIEKAESPEQALMREIREELGFNLKKYEFLGVFSGKSKNLETTRYAFTAKLENIKNFKQMEGRGMKLFTIQQAQKLTFGRPWYKEVLAALKKKLKARKK